MNFDLIAGLGIAAAFILFGVGSWLSNRRLQEAKRRGWV